MSQENVVKERQTLPKRNFHNEESQQVAMFRLWPAQVGQFYGNNKQVPETQIKRAQNEEKGSPHGEPYLPQKH